jgi:phospholipid/cholesterol/gamma-HCH transport system substrate-binding protein
MEEISKTVKSINDQDLVGEIKTGINSFTATVQDIQDAVQELKAGNVFANAGTVMSNLKSATHNIDIISADIANGCGTIGRLIKYDDMYMRMSSLMSKADTTLNDINHYGILFHLNKNWQRQRAQRITVLNALDNPSNFKSYFEKEVAEINTAMARLSMLIDKAELSPDREEILTNPQFHKDFRELLLQADTFSENLKLYNEQFTEAQD